MNAPNRRPLTVESGSLPPSIRILPNRSWLRFGLVAGLALAVASAGVQVLSPGAPAFGPAALGWGTTGAGLMIAAACAFRLFAQLPVIEASELGVAVWFHGPYRRPFFVPWNRIRSVAVTQLAQAGGTRRRRIEALTIDLIEDVEFRIPAVREGAGATVRGAHPSQLAWPDSALDGAVRHWAGLMQAMQSADIAAGRAAAPAS